MFPDALEAAGRVEGLPLSSPQPLPEPGEDKAEASVERGPKRRGRYRQSLQLLKPFRITQRHQHPVDNAGLLSSMTLNWLSPLALKAYKKSSLSIDDVWGLSCHEASGINCQRLETLWHDELKRRGREAASLTRVFWRFCQTRMLAAAVSLLLTMVASFVGPVNSVQILLSLNVFLIQLICLAARPLATSPKSMYFMKVALSCFTLVWQLKWKHTGRLQSLRW